MFGHLPSYRSLSWGRSLEIPDGGLEVVTNQGNSLAPYFECGNRQGEICSRGDEIGTSLPFPCPSFRGTSVLGEHQVLKFVP